MPDVRWPNDFVGDRDSCVFKDRQFSENANVSCKCVMPMCHANMSYYTTHKQSVWTLQPLFSGMSQRLDSALAVQRFPHRFPRIYTLYMQHVRLALGQNFLLRFLQQLYGQ